MTKPIIFLDMDGVLADFHQGTADIFKVDLAECTMPRPWEYAVEIQIEWLMQNMGRDEKLSSHTMWRMINDQSLCNDFWFNLKPYSWAHELYKLCLHNSSRLIISTSPGYHYKAWGDKIRWLEKHLNHHPKDVMMGQAKHLLARHTNCILIDDCQQNCDNFRQAGGKAFVFPQPWNNNHGLVPNRLDAVKHYLELIHDPSI